MWLSSRLLCSRTQKGVQLHVGKGGAVGGLRDRGKARPSEALLSAEELALYFGVKATTVYRWCKEGSVPCMKIGRYWRVRREELVDFLKKIEESRGARRPR